ncbi:protein-L-isoaspartate O-methyltransferase [Mesorhizobium sp.]|uniref:protein-L-isoaspartate O-methyltransferase family protein n=1 Tax=Mesorhizobium sp. TaxID=1871066 RepID=UPI000FE47BB9|nr:protein-L-isoaspartate O-methyltransferase [Mesorhizobium sp.]RWA60604.1 MAG: protein-L-isoaspartate O-methyltransferase [Mesorhizobium sp.]
MTGTAEARQFYARLMAAHAGSADPRLEEAFATVPREAFLGPGPWTIIAGDGRVETPTADPSHIYQNVLVALDADKGINNGEPILHAMWIGKVAPKPGEVVTHIGAGTGYYTALLAKLVAPGAVIAFELDAALAARAEENLAAFGNVTVIHGNAVASPLPPSDIVYVNAGVAAPPAAWLKALKPGGRMVFPWRPAERVALAVLVTSTESGFACRPFMGSWFIPCVGASTTDPSAKIPDREKAARSRSIWLISDKAPDRTATAIIGDVWFSSRGVDGSGDERAERQNLLRPLSGRRPSRRP